MLHAIDAAVVLCVCLGLGLVVTGFVGFKKGRIWIGGPDDKSLLEARKKSFLPGLGVLFVRQFYTYHTIERSEKPGAFWAVTICLYWAFGLFFIACSALFVMQNLGYVARP